MQLTCLAGAVALWTAFPFSLAAQGAETAEALITKGNAYYDKLQPTEALLYYLPAEKLDANNPDLLVRIARQYRHLMSEAGPTEEKVRLCRVAITYANRAAALAPEDPEAQLAVAISYGKILPFVSTKERLQDARIVKTAAEKTLKLNPKSDLAWHVLGRWNRTFAEVSPAKRAVGKLLFGEIPTTTYQDAVTCFEKAIALDPNRLMHFIELGRTYAEMGRSSDARRYISKGLAMQETEKDDPQTKREGREVLATLKKG